MADMPGWNQNKKKTWYHRNIDPSLRPITHCSEVPGPVFASVLDLTSELGWNIIGSNAIRR